MSDARTRPRNLQITSLLKNKKGKRDTRDGTGAEKGLESCPALNRPAPRLERKIAGIVVQILTRNQR